MFLFLSFQRTITVFNITITIITNHSMLLRKHRVSLRFEGAQPAGLCNYPGITGIKPFISNPMKTPTKTKRLLVLHYRAF